MSTPQKTTSAKATGTSAGNPATTATAQKLPVSAGSTAEPAKVTKPREPLLIDYSKVEAVESEALTSERTSNVDQTPFPKMIADSWATRAPSKTGRVVGKTFAVTVPAKAGKQTLNLVRRAASRAGVGVRIRMKDVGGDRVQVVFQTQERQQYKPKS